MASRDRRDGAPRSGAPESQKGNGGTSAPPVYSRRYWTGSGTVEIAVFSREISGDGGSSFISYSVGLKRVFKDGDEYKQTHSFRPEDLLVAAHALEQAYAFIASEHQKG